jgi:hypothetical protein
MPSQHHTFAGRKPVDRCRYLIGYLNREVENAQAKVANVPRQAGTAPETEAAS